MYADDMKIFERVPTNLGYEALQSSLNNIGDWCRANGMELNATKCVVLSYKRGANTFTNEYYLNSTLLRRVDKVKDLGVIMSPSLSPQEHILQIIAQELTRYWGSYLDPRNISTHHTLLSSCISLWFSPVLEYGSVIWSPYQFNHIAQLQGVQERFIRMLGSRLGFTYRTTPISEVEVESQFNLLPLHRRRQLTDLVTLFKLVNGLLDCPGLLSGIDFSISRGTRSMTIFRRRYHPTYYAYHSGLSRLLRTGGDAAPHVDFFNETVASFKRKVASLVNN
ncbi:uncharacterized protein LOC124358186 [Homalodisca vitripennis]|uniref:uncharacterized protein LOC124358186 n=1 Tax=Homalodisca vitripennis TaxID=197043 RepID=UPI001EEC1DAC|nr:uncharacterized protein LOC124358186 [Homalodisca vitripennis]